MILLIVFLIVVVAVGAFALFGPPSRMLSGPSTSSAPQRNSSRPQTANQAPQWSAPEFNVPRLRNFPPGCLIGLILAALVWFTLWAVVLVFALRFLQTPYTGG